MTATSEVQPVKPQPKRIVFLDTETTDLDPLNDQIIEIGVIVTDENLREVARWSKTLPLLACSWHDLQMPQVVRDMHNASGLALEVQALSDTLDDEDAYAYHHKAALDLTKFLIDNGCKGAPLAGFSVGDFDRHFLRTWETDNDDDARPLSVLSHRSLNVSTFRVLHDLWDLPNPPKRGDGSRHRAIGDCEDAIRLFREYSKCFARLDVEAFDRGLTAE